MSSNTVTTAQLEAMRREFEAKMEAMAAENERLRAQAKRSSKPFSVEVGEYNGNPTLGFSGNFKPWRKMEGAIAELFANAFEILTAMQDPSHIADAEAGIRDAYKAITNPEAKKAS